MNKFIVLTLFTATIVLAFALSKPLGKEVTTTLKVMSYNIRTDSQDDYAINRGWNQRKELLAKQIEYYNAEIIGMQEVMIHQAQYLDSLLEAYTWYGIGRDDGKLSGEMMTIFYKEKSFKPLNKGTFWLSPEPSRPGLGWDAACNRVVTWMKLLHRHSEDTLFIFNTHFDHEGKLARLKSAGHLRDSIFSIAGGYPFILTGDLNFTPSDPPYKVLVEDTSRNIMDTYYTAKKNVSPPGTSSGFMACSGKKLKRIDYVLVSKQFTCESHFVPTDLRNDKFFSDHLPVIVELRHDKN
jgi:endonuclease/exonuclease/phosphatase family metal-dependent hydrolase